MLKWDHKGAFWNPKYDWFEVTYNITDAYALFSI